MNTKDRVKNLLDSSRVKDKLAEDLGFFYGYCSNDEIEKILNDKSCKFAEVDHYGGEGQGERYYTTYSVTDLISTETVYVQFYGYYTSYDGATYEGWKFVEPITKTITVYE
jgi:hypothetical protein